MSETAGLPNRRPLKFRAWIEFAKQMVAVKNLCADNLAFTTHDDEAIPWVNGPIMQFTGLHDKNGEEIYEGDILRGSGDESHVKAVVTEYEGCFVGKYTDAALDKYSPQIRFFLLEYTVVGNLYENPELLKV